MKINSILFSTLCSIIIGMSFTACSDNIAEEEEENIVDPVAYPIYILNEGHWGANNAGIAMFHHPSEGVITNDKYLEVNEMKMGDVANALLEEDDNLYVLLNGSKYVARLYLNTKERARYTFPEGEGAPRCMEVEGNYAYVTQYGGQVTKLNIENMTKVGVFNKGDNLEGIVEQDGKLYVANSYKADGSGNYIYNKEVFVVDAQTMTLINTITVVDNPTKLYEIDDKIYLISAGNYNDVPGALQVIDTKAATSKVILNDVIKVTKGFNGLIYGVRSTYDANWQLTNSFFTYNQKTGVINETSFLQDAPNSFETDAIYLVEVDEEGEFIYVGTTDYQNTGTIYAFDKNGKLFHSFDSGGVNPSAMVFVELK